MKDHNFYSINYTAEESVIASYPQIIDYVGDLAKFRKQLSSDLRVNELPFFEFSLDSFVLNPRSELTDFVSTGIIDWTGFMVSGKVKKLLESSELPPHKFYKATLLHRDTSYSDYYWFLPVVEAEEFIKLDSSFEIVDWFDKNNVVQECVVFQSIADIKAFAQKEAGIMRIKPKKVFLKKRNCTYDLFRFTKINFDFIISEKLKNKLEERKITGYEVRKIHWLYVED